jgi:predicted MFS family arabinose efflux permease
MLYLLFALGLSLIAVSLAGSWVYGRTPKRFYLVAALCLIAAIVVMVLAIGRGLNI